MKVGAQNPSLGTCEHSGDFLLDKELRRGTVSAWAFEVEPL